MQTGCTDAACRPPVDVSHVSRLRNGSRASFPAAVRLRLGNRWEDMCEHMTGAVDTCQHMKGGLHAAFVQLVCIQIFSAKQRRTQVLSCSVFFFIAPDEGQKQQA